MSRDDDLVTQNLDAPDPDFYRNALLHGEPYVAAELLPCRYTLPGGLAATGLLVKSSTRRPDQHLAELDGYTREATPRHRRGVVDWPTGGVPITKDDTSRGSVWRLENGSVACRLPGADMWEIGPADWDSGYPVTGSDGRYPTRWPTLEHAKYMAYLRQKLRALPRQGEHWVGPTTPGHRYSKIKVRIPWFAPFGYTTTRPRGSDQRITGHRASFIAFHGHTPRLGTVEHRCNRRWCVNPDCLADMSFDENQVLSREYSEQIKAGTAQPRRHARPSTATTRTLNP